MQYLFVMHLTKYWNITFTRITLFGSELKNDANYDKIHLTYYIKWLQSIHFIYDMSLDGRWCKLQLALLVEEYTREKVILVVNII